jgi:hypothetical protein
MKKIITIFLVIINIIAITFFLVFNFKEKQQPIKYVNVKAMYCKVVTEATKDLKDEYIYLNEYGRVTKIIQKVEKKYNSDSEYDFDLSQYQESYRDEPSIKVIGDKLNRTIEINQASKPKEFVTLYSLINVMGDNYKCEMYEYE